MNAAASATYLFQLPPVPGLKATTIPSQLFWVGVSCTQSDEAVSSFPRTCFCTCPPLIPQLTFPPFSPYTLPAADESTPTAPAILRGFRVAAAGLSQPEPGTAGLNLLFFLLAENPDAPPPLVFRLSR